MRVRAILIPFALAAALSAHGVNLVQNGSFESNNVALGSYGYVSSNPSLVATPWTFTSGAGVTSNGAAFGGFAQDGNYFAFLQSNLDPMVTNTVAQTLTGLQSFKEYTVSYYALQRPGSGTNVVTAVGNSQVVMSATPGSAGAYTLYTGQFFSTSSTANLSFTVGQGTTSDSGSFIDNVSVTAVPGPLAALPFALGVLKRRRKA